MDMDLYRLAAVDNCSVHVCEGKIIFCLVPIQQNVKKENLRFKKIYMNQAIANSINNTSIRIFLLHLKYNTEIVIAFVQSLLICPRQNLSSIHIVTETPRGYMYPLYHWSILTIFFRSASQKVEYQIGFSNYGRKICDFEVFFNTFVLKVLQCRLTALIKHRVKFAINVMFFP